MNIKGEHCIVGVCPICRKKNIVKIDKHGHMVNGHEIAETCEHFSGWSIHSDGCRNMYDMRFYEVNVNNIGE
jgi:5'(3')-deoxyribonucleotidase